MIEKFNGFELLILYKFYLNHKLIQDRDHVAYILKCHKNKNMFVITVTVCY